MAPSMASMSRRCGFAARPIILTSRAHHTYGHNDSWRVLPTWKQALDAPGAPSWGFSRRY